MHSEHSNIRSLVNFIKEAEQISMEKLIRPCDKEYMRMTMLKHQDTFNEQVYELHRLYGIQKILMKNTEANRGIEVNQRGWNLTNVISLTKHDCHKGALKNPKLKFDLEIPATEDTAQSDSNGVLEIINETEIELTLGPSCYNRKKVETPLTSGSAHSLSSSSTGSSLISKTRLKTRHSSHSTIEELKWRYNWSCPGATFNQRVSKWN
ncbi:uncharacterized protein LOC124845634 [Vigna umbellata]|uniref:uncharacterized protein LOC124845634 n=1 Tax=Vigna umbellata TaxID=87088 RepID=UPI001F5F3B59|nr:uncharacterized protein LOC124845634 [Vigna umbellata]